MLTQHEKGGGIGFAKLPEQLHRKTAKKVFEFNLMIVGESGLGKSTLINSLFLGDLYKNRKEINVNDRISKTTTIEKKTMDIEEKGVRVRLTIIDTPGFEDGINCEDSWKVCSDFIDEQFRKYYNDENGFNRKNIQDNRVHCCLYCIPSYCYSLRQMDIEIMKRLHKKVNLIVIIAKADTLTLTEKHLFKKRILHDIEMSEIQLYQFPEYDSDEDEDFKRQDCELKASIPFAVISSNLILDIQGKKIRARQYPWGIINVEDPNHSDFIKLRTMLISTHMQDLKDVTEEVHYENFRAKYLAKHKSNRVLNEKRKDNDENQGQMQTNYISKTDKLLIQKDEEIRRMQDMLTKIKEKLKTDDNLESTKHDSVIEV